MEILQPSYIQFYPNLFLLSQQRISLQHAQALRKYLAGVKSIQDKLVYKLIIDACQMSDDVLQELLLGIYHQCELDSDGQIKTQCLRTFIYSNNSLGLKSIKQLLLFIPHFFDLNLNNITFVGGIDDHGVKKTN